MNSNLNIIIFALLLGIISCSWLLNEETTLVKSWNCGGSKLELLDYKENFGGGFRHLQVLRFNQKKISTIGAFGGGSYPIEPFRRKGWIVEEFLGQKDSNLWNVYLSPRAYTLEEFNSLVACLKTNLGEFNQLATAPNFDQPFTIGRLIYGDPAPHLEFKHKQTLQYKPSPAFPDATVAYESIAIFDDGGIVLFINFEKPDRISGVTEQSVRSGNVRLKNNQLVLEMGAKPELSFLSQDNFTKEELIQYLQNFTDEKGKKLLDYYDRIDISD